MYHCNDIWINDLMTDIIEYISLLKSVSIEDIRPLVALYNEKEKRKRVWKVNLAILISFLMITQAIIIYFPQTILLLGLLSIFVIIFISSFVMNLICAKKSKDIFDMQIRDIALAQNFSYYQLKKEIDWLFKHVEDVMQPWNNIEKIHDLG